MSCLILYPISTYFGSLVIFTLVMRSMRHENCDVGNEANGGTLMLSTEVIQLTPLLWQGVLAVELQKDQQALESPQRQSP